MHRIGQTSNVDIHYLVAKGTADDYLWYVSAGGWCGSTVRPVAASAIKNKDVCLFIERIRLPEFVFCFLLVVLNQKI